MPPRRGGYRPRRGGFHALAAGGDGGEGGQSGGGAGEDSAIGAGAGSGDDDASALPATPVKPMSRARTGTSDAPPSSPSTQPPPMQMSHATVPEPVAAEMDREPMAGVTPSAGTVGTAAPAAAAPRQPAQRLASLKKPRAPAASSAATPNPSRPGSATPAPGDPPAKPVLRRQPRAVQRRSKEAREALEHEEAERQRERDAETVAIRRAQIRKERGPGPDRGGRGGGRGGRGGERGAGAGPGRGPIKMESGPARRPRADGLSSDEGSDSGPRFSIERINLESDEEPSDDEGKAKGKIKDKSKSSTGPVDRGVLRPDRVEWVEHGAQPTAPPGAEMQASNVVVDEQAAQAAREAKRARRAERAQRTEERRRHAQEERERRLATQGESLFFNEDDDAAAAVAAAADTEIEESESESESESEGKDDGSDVQMTDASNVQPASVPAETDVPIKPEPVDDDVLGAFTPQTMQQQQQKPKPKKKFKKSAAPPAQTDDERAEQARYIADIAQLKRMLGTVCRDPETDVKLPPSTAAAITADPDAATKDSAAREAMQKEAEEIQYQRQSRLFLIQFPPRTPRLVAPSRAGTAGGNANAGVPISVPMPGIKTEPGSNPEATPDLTSVSDTQASLLTAADLSASTIGSGSIATPRPSQQLPPGRAGQLRVHASGRVTMQWGFGVSATAADGASTAGGFDGANGNANGPENTGIAFELNKGADVSFLQDAILIGPGPRPGTKGSPPIPGTVWSMSQVGGKLVVVPDWGA